MLRANDVVGRIAGGHRGRRRRDWSALDGERLVPLIACLFLLAGCEDDGFEPDPYDLDFDIPRTEDFADKLSAYSLFEAPMDGLQPAEGVMLYELSSELFTDYAFKQRLLKVPDETAVTLEGDTTFAYPERTLFAKTFYYPSDVRDAEASLRIIETRLLVKREGLWNVATYLWNDEQTDATLLLDGTTTAVSWIDEAGQSRKTDYAVPHEGECVTCHQADESSVFIGPTPRNLNRIVVRGDDEVNQLTFFQAEGVFDDVDEGAVATIPNYQDDAESLEDRARAYLDINCAHCHNPQGWDDASRRDLDLRFSTSLGQTGLSAKKREMERQLGDGEMPYLGTTLLHDKGIRLVLDYVDSL